MQRTGRHSDPKAIPTQTALAAGHSDRRAAPRGSDRRFEQRLQVEFRRYAQDVPEAAFPTFLETLYCEPLAEPPARGSRPRSTGRPS